MNSEKHCNSYILLVLQKEEQATDRIKINFRRSVLILMQRVMQNRVAFNQRMLLLTYNGNCDIINIADEESVEFPLPYRRAGSNLLIPTG